MGKAVALYLSRVAPSPTIDYLVQELAQQIRQGQPARGPALTRVAGLGRVQLNPSFLAVVWVVLIML